MNLEELDNRLMLITQMCRGVKGVQQAKDVDLKQVAISIVK